MDNKSLPEEESGSVLDDQRCIARHEAASIWPCLRRSSAPALHPNKKSVSKFFGSQSPNWVIIYLNDVNKILLNTKRSI